MLALPTWLLRKVSIDTVLTRTTKNWCWLIVQLGFCVTYDTLQYNRQSIMQALPTWVLQQQHGRRELHKLLTRFVWVFVLRNQLLIFQSFYKSFLLIEYNQNWVPFFFAAYRILCFTPEFHFLFTVYARYFLQVGFTELPVDLKAVRVFFYCCCRFGRGSQYFGERPTSHASIPCLPSPAQIHRHTRPNPAGPDSI